MTIFEKLTAAWLLVNAALFAAGLVLHWPAKEG